MRWGALLLLMLASWGCDEPQDNAPCRNHRDCLETEVCVDKRNSPAEETPDGIIGVCKKRHGEFCIRHSECSSGNCDEDEHRCRTSG